MILDTIIEKKKARLETEKQALPVETLRRAAESSRNKTRDFKAALRQDGVSIIAEIKKASPSKGVIKSDFDPLQTAREYERSGAAAISVLTEEDFFLGKSEYLTQVKNLAGVPVLRKDFIFDPWQVWQSAHLGADAILLIAAVLTTEKLKTLRILAGDLGMDALVEAHDQDEVKMALESGAEIIGINNRDLKTFKVDIGTTGKLAGGIPPGISVVSESGINTAADMEYLMGLGVDAALVGESLMKAGSISGKMKELKGEACGKG
jgi:indole-3-glycerol phosphate synthase